MDFVRHCWFLTGPTAAGKSAVGAELTRQIDGEILSLDSMAVYRGMDVGTAKPTMAEQGGAPHHLLDVVEPDEDFSIAQYLTAAGDAVESILARGRRPLFVGGTPLYLKALLRGLFNGPAANWELRRRLAELARVEGPAALHARLAAADPQAAARLHPNDSRRLIRALEVFEQTGRPISGMQREFSTARAAGDCRVFVLNRSREDLHRRIEARVEAMFAGGWIDEVRGVVAAGRPLSRTAGQAVGYREILEYLAGQRDLAETIELVKRRTRQFAKRQLTWFRSLSECTWIDVHEPSEPIKIAEAIAARGTGG
jgi:tRNA dimethylallyltransferase